MGLAGYQAEAAKFNSFSADGVFGSYRLSPSNLHRDTLLPVSPIILNENSQCSGWQGGTTIMRFTLLYDGPLPVNGTKDEKQQIRMQLSPQLERQWMRPALAATFSNLRQNQYWNRFYAKQVRGVPFIPLAIASLHLTCALDVDFLRAEEPGAVIQGGDIDNRLKTLFDAMRIPQEPELPRAFAPDSFSPVYCLLEDDRLITDIRVKTDTLLSAPTTANAVRLVMRVKLQATELNTTNFIFGG
jgi:hypothetical protein